MRFNFSSCMLVAALIGVLLPLLLVGAPVRAQTIVNVAQAEWTIGNSRLQTESNEVSITLDPRPPEITVFRQVPSGGLQLDFLQSACGAQSTGFTSQAAPTAFETASVVNTTTIQSGQSLFVQVDAFDANLDPTIVDELQIVVETTSGDREQLTIYETGPDTGVFVGQIATARFPLSSVQGDCILSLSDGDQVEIAALDPSQQSIIVSAEIDALVDPFGVIFDSESGELIDGAQVTLINSETGQPATVFAEDGVTSWPSTIESGQSITDGAGNVVVLGPGEFWFPQTASGEYRLEVNPPQPYSAPSVVSPQELARLTGPGGRSFVVTDGSYGETFTLIGPVPEQIDIPLDRPSLGVELSKEASKQFAQPGDVIFYTLTVRNEDQDRSKRNVRIVDTPSQWLRLRKDSIRSDGVAAADAVNVTPDGRTLTFDIGDVSPNVSHRITYAMIVRADAPPGHAINEAIATDSLGRSATAQASVKIERDSLTSRFTIIGRVTAGDCSIHDDFRIGLPGVRIIMEDGSFAITDADGRYHFEGVAPGSHVVQAARQTLPKGGKFVDCHRSTRNAGSDNSRFVIGQGGSLVVADFHATIPTTLNAQVNATDDRKPNPGMNAQDPKVVPLDKDAVQLGSQDYWLGLGDGPDGWLTPQIGHNPRSPAVWVAIRHRKGQKIVLRADGVEVDPLSFEGSQTAPKGRYAVSVWRAVKLKDERTALSADIINSFGEVSKTIEREVFFTTTPVKAELIPELSNLVADGSTRPVVAVRVLDRNNRPLREGVSGEFKLNAPYQSAEQVDRQQLNQLTGLSASSARWTIKGDDGIALIELAPTMVSGSLKLDFRFTDGEISRNQELEAWIQPGDMEWTVVGLVEGSIGARTVADNMERSGRFDSDLGDKARIALYAKGRVLGRYLLTLSYDSAKQRDDQRLLGTLDPNAYYTVFADASSRRFDAPSREKLYVRIETSTFYALYGDFETGFDQTQLTRYNRVATGVKGEALIGSIRAKAFAAKIGSRQQHEEIQGQGISGPYSLASRRIVPGSERVMIEVRDRFRSEQIISSQELTRFSDYDIDLLSGTITFREPVLSRDLNLNPQFIVIDYETDALADGEYNAGVRTDWTDKSGKVRVGATAVSDKGDGSRTNIVGADVKAQIDESTLLRAELAMSRRDGETSTAWHVEAQHQTTNVDVIGYARSTEATFGVGQQSGAELGRRKFGVDGRVMLSEDLSVLGSVWQDDSLADATRRRAAQLRFGYTADDTDVRVGLAHFNDRLADSTTNSSTVLEGSVTQRLLNNQLELSAASSVALDSAQSVDLPVRHRFGVRYSLTSDVKISGLYEIADGDSLSSRSLRAGIEVSPWQGAQIISSLGKERVDEYGNRSFATFGLAQSFAVSPSLTLDFTVDGSRTLGTNPQFADVVNAQHPIASGGQIIGGNAPTQSGSLFEDFTAFTTGAAWRKDRWSATARGEYRDGEFANRKGLTLGAIRQLGNGSVVGSGITWTKADGANAVSTEILDAALAFAYRPDSSEFSALSKLEFRSDSVENAVSGEAGSAGRTALAVTGDAKSRRLLASLSTNWSPRGADEFGHMTRRDEYELFLAIRHNFDQFEGLDLSGTSLMGGADARFGLSERVEIGVSGNIRTNLDDNVTKFAVGPQVGLVPADGMLVTLGYNFEGYRDPDFSEARHTDEGIYLAMRFKLDADALSFLGLSQ